MQTNKAMTELDDTGPGTEIWNQYLSDNAASGAGITWYGATWMWAECYMYRQDYVISSQYHFNFCLGINFSSSYFYKIYLK